MMQVGRFGITIIALAVGFVASSSRVDAAYSCKGDRRLDVAMDFTATVRGNQVHLSATGGSDKSTYVVPSVWRLLDSSGTKQLDYFPQGLLVFVSMNMLKEANLDGLAPGSYHIELTSVDFCNNAGKVRHPIDVSTPLPESNLPVLSTPTIAMIGLQTGQFGQIQFRVTDDSGIQQIDVRVAGTLIKQYKYCNGASFRWWFDDYAADNTQSVLEGPYYYVNYPTSYKGQYLLVEVDATDVVGNVTRTSAWLML